MEFKWVCHQAGKFKDRAVKLAIRCDEADANYRREPTEENMAEAKSAGAAMGSLFDEVWRSLYGGGFQDEYDRVADHLCSDVKFETGINIKVFAH